MASTFHLHPLQTFDSPSNWPTDRLRLHLMQCRCAQLKWTCLSVDRRKRARWSGFMGPRFISILFRRVDRDKDDREDDDDHEKVVHVDHSGLRVSRSISWTAC